MNNFYSQFKNQSGAIGIFITMMILTGMLFVTFTINSIVINGIKMSGAHLNSTKAYFAAESGTEHILWRIRKKDATSFNPTSVYTSSNNVTDYCVKLAGNQLDTSNIDCNTPVVGLKAQIHNVLPSNESLYRIKYEYDPLTQLATFSTTGIYKDITKRVVQVQYHF